MIALAIGTLWRPSVAVAGMLILFGFEQWLQTQQGIFLRYSFLSNVGLACLVVLGLVMAGLRQRLHLVEYPKVGYLVIALLAFSLLSYLWTPDRPAFVTRWVLAGPYLLTIVLMMPLLVRDWRDMQTALYATLVLGTLTLLLLAFDVEWTHRGVALDRDQKGSALGVASLAGYVALIALLINFTGVARVWQFARWGVFLLGLYIAIRSGSRGQAIAMVFAAIVFLPMSRRFASLKGFFTTVITVAVIGTIVAIAQSIWANKRRWDLSEMTDVYGETRIEMISTVLSNWFNAGPLNWVIGLGNSSSFAEDSIGRYPHVVLGEVLAEEGFIGFALFVAIIYITFRTIIRGGRMAKDLPGMRGVYAGLGAMFLFDFILSFKQGSMIGSPYLFAFCILLGRVEKTAHFDQGLIAQRPMA